MPRPSIGYTIRYSPWLRTVFTLQWARPSPAQRAASCNIQFLQELPTWWLLAALCLQMHPEYLHVTVTMISTCPWMSSGGAAGCGERVEAGRGGQEPRPAAGRGAALLHVGGGHRRAATLLLWGPGIHPQPCWRRHKRPYLLQVSRDARLPSACQESCACCSKVQGLPWSFLRLP